MTVSNTPGIIAKFKRTPWSYQATFATPLKDLDNFVSTLLLSVNKPLEESCITIDSIVFEPKKLNALVSQHFLSISLGKNSSLSVKSNEQVHKSLHAAFSDWVDFLFVPTPKPFVIYADHDEHTTFYANTKSNLSGVVGALQNKGFKVVPNYERKF